MVFGRAPKARLRETQLAARGEINAAGRPAKLTPHARNPLCWDNLDTPAWDKLSAFFEITRPRVRARV